MLPIIQRLQDGPVPSSGLVILACTSLASKDVPLAGHCRQKLSGVVFNQCLDSGQHKADVDRDWQAAVRLGFIGTPSFLVNQQKLVGPASFEVFSAALDANLKTAKP